MKPEQIIKNVSSIVLYTLYSILWAKNEKSCNQNYNCFFQSKITSTSLLHTSLTTFWFSRKYFIVVYKKVEWAQNNCTIKTSLKLIFKFAIFSSSSSHDFPVKYRENYCRGTRAKRLPFRGWVFFTFPKRPPISHKMCNEVETFHVSCSG